MIKFIMDKKTRVAFIHISELSHDTIRAVRQALFRLGTKLRKDTKKDILRKGRIGNVYRIRRGARYINHIASIPGEAPASITGRLWRSLEFAVNGFRMLTFGYNDSAPYGKFLEEGTSRMDARPALAINIEKNGEEGGKILDSEIRKALK